MGSGESLDGSFEGLLGPIIVRIEDHILWDW
jgi:hypothetical protein